jgi:DNA-binding FadR family transcriptional regulator
LVNLSLRELFTIAARGSHRPRAIVEHRELMEAIIGGKPELAREISLRMVQNASGDVAKIRLSEDAQVPHINSRTDN